MTDLLVKLYHLPDSEPNPSLPTGVHIRRARAPEREPILQFVENTFGSSWRGECAVAFGGHPITCIVASEKEATIGFACYDASFRGFFGPVGVAPSKRGNGIGTALTLAALNAMKETGYAYAIIGATKAADYYQSIVDATVIPDSWPGAYEDLVKG